jgi:hypothetical protein
LDTLNEEDGGGHNVEIGLTTTADPERLKMDWAWGCEHYGERHLIHGLYTVHAAIMALDLEYELNNPAEYIFFLGYSGIVLASALEELPVSWDSLYVWGFHDGDLAFLARGSPTGVKRLATFEGT